MKSSVEVSCTHLHKNTNPELTGCNEYVGRNAAVIPPLWGNPGINVHCYDKLCISR